MEAGGLANAYGNGITIPFLIIYLHNVRGFSLATAGLVLATSGLVGLVASPLAGWITDHTGARVTRAGSLVLLAAGYGIFPLVREPWHAFAAMAVAGAGNAGFWPSQSTLLAGLTPPPRRHAAYALQRVTRNLGIGLGGVTGGFIATTSSPGSFTVLFLRVFVGVVVRNVVFVSAGYAVFELLPVFAKNEASVSEKGIGLIFLVNTVLIVVLQLPIAKLLEGRRRMRALAFMTALWAEAWLLVLAGGSWLEATAAVGVFAVAAMVFGLGECFQGPTQGALVADLAPARLRGRYMALSTISWEIGFVIGPAAGGLILGLSPLALWPIAAGVCVAAGAAALALERGIPRELRLTPA